MIKNIVYRHIAPYTIKKFYTNLDDPPKGYIRVKFLYCGICGGDYSCYLGRRTDYPISLGHEWIGEVVQVGEEIDTIKKEMLVVTDFNYRCGKCEYCKSGRSHLCCQNGAGLFSNRGFAQYANIHHSYVFPIFNLEWLPRACLIEPLSCVLYALQAFKVHLDTPVLLCGGGSIGTLICFYLTRIMHHNRIYIVEKNGARLNNLITHFQAIKFDTKAEVFFDTVIDCTNSIDGLTLAFNSIKQGGDICIMSHLYGLDTSFVYESICKKELHALFPLRNGSSDNINTAIALIQKFWTADDDCMIQVYNDITTAFEEKELSPCNKQVVSFMNTVREFEV